MPKVFRVEMKSGEKTEVDMAKEFIDGHRMNKETLMAVVNGWNWKAVLQAQVNAANKTNNSLWLYYWE